MTRGQGGKNDTLVLNSTPGLTRLSAILLSYYPATPRPPPLREIALQRLIQRLVDGVVFVVDFLVERLVLVVLATLITERQAFSTLE